MGAPHIVVGEGKTMAIGIKTGVEQANGNANEFAGAVTDNAGTVKPTKSPMRTVAAWVAFSAIVGAIVGNIFLVAARALHLLPT